MKAIKTRHDAVNFIHQSIIWVGIAFHPDTRFSDYVDGDGNTVFTPPQARSHQLDLEECIDILGSVEDVCDIGLEFARKMGYAPALPIAEKQPIDWNEEMDNMARKAAQACEYIKQTVTEDMGIEFFHGGHMIDGLVSHGSGKVELSCLGGFVAWHTDLDQGDMIWLARQVQKAIAERNPQP